MNYCQKCDKNFDNGDTKFCSFCGSPLKAIESSGQSSPEEDADLDFVVTESASATPEFVGGAGTFAQDAEPLEIERPTTESSKPGEAPEFRPGDEDHRPIGQSAPIMPGAYHSDSGANDDVGIDTAETNVQNDNTGPVPLKKLSDEEVESINKNLYGSAEYLSKDAKGQLINKISKLNKKVEFPGNSRKSTIPEPRSEEVSKPQMAPHSKGVAFFYKNYVELQGIKNLHLGDELEFEGRHYQLSPKNLNTRWTWGVGIGFFAIFLIFVGSLFVSDSGNINGQIVGLILTDDNSPFIHGAEIRLVETGDKLKSNGQGFFTFDNLPSGSYSLECYVDGDLVRSEMATVSEGLTTTLTISPDDIADRNSSAKKDKPRAEAETSKSAAKPEVILASATETKQETTPPKTTSSSNSTVNPNEPGKVVLSANVKNAKLVLDGKVMGAGNLTYTSIKPGTHTYQVSADGYQEAGGTIRISPGEKETIKVSLAPMSTQAKSVEYDAEDFYHSAYTALKEQDFETALGDFNKAIELKPSYAEAYFYRGETFAATFDNEAAHDDFIRAAEQFQFKKQSSDAVTAYNRALEINKESIGAHLGRGSLYLQRNETFAAVADFEAAVDIDQRNFQAQYGLGEARFQQGNYKKAIEHFKRARSLDDNNPLVYQYLMLAYMASDDIKEVRKSFDKFEEIASQEQLARFKSDNRFTAVLKVIDSN